jgi:hypothetical protein
MPIETQLNRTQLQEDQKEVPAVLNPAADPRKIRRIIAEDPEWNLETVSPLVDLTICHIVANFEHNPLLEELPIQYRRKVLDKLPPTVSLKYY